MLCVNLHSRSLWRQVLTLDLKNINAFSLLTSPFPLPITKQSASSKAPFFKSCSPGLSLYCFSCYFKINALARVSVCVMTAVLTAFLTLCFQWDTNRRLLSPVLFNNTIFQFKGLHHMWTPILPVVISTIWPYSTYLEAFPPLFSVFG